MTKTSTIEDANARARAMWERAAHPASAAVEAMPRLVDFDGGLRCDRCHRHPVLGDHDCGLAALRREAASAIRGTAQSIEPPRAAWIEQPSPLPRLPIAEPTAAEYAAAAKRAAFGQPDSWDSVSIGGVQVGADGISRVYIADEAPASPARAAMIADLAARFFHRRYSERDASPLGYVARDDANARAYLERAKQAAGCDVTGWGGSKPHNSRRDSVPGGVAQWDAGDSDTASQAATLAATVRELEASGYCFDITKMERLGAANIGHSYSAPPPVPLTARIGDGPPIPLGTIVNATPDPRLAREQRRREIDAVLRDDARRWPAFAEARRAAVMAVAEGFDLLHGDATEILRGAHRFERNRGTATAPEPHALACWQMYSGVVADFDGMVAVYERARRTSPVASTLPDVAHTWEVWALP